MQSTRGGVLVLVLALAVAASACTDGDATTSSSEASATAGAADSSGSDGGAATTADDGVDDDDASSGAIDSTGADPRELASVGHEREFRAVWVATVNNINFPSSPGIDAGAMQAELRAMVDTAVATNLNVIVFQVRPECDAVYASELEPWSRYLTGTQGEDPGFDPLAYLVDEAHARGIEVHAWFNPYRAKANVGDPVVLPHLSLQYPEYAYEYGAFMWMDPAAIEVRE
ncbi:MAG TPA: family 10 glycosylhydrolase, partial [Nannocystaceae bacterium]|nr:family 10 glycosylhydrolase [Nannocystaceae bacterium]